MKIIIFLSFITIFIFNLNFKSVFAQTDSTGVFQAGFSSVNTAILSTTTPTPEPTAVPTPISTPILYQVPYNSHEIYGVFAGVEMEVKKIDDQSASSSQDSQGSNQQQPSSQNSNQQPSVQGVTAGTSTPSPTKIYKKIQPTLSPTPEVSETPTATPSVEAASTQIIENPPQPSLIIRLVNWLHKLFLWGK